MSDTEFKYLPRGIGSNWLPCFICGHKRVERCQADMAAFVDASLIHIYPEFVKDDEGKRVVEHPIMRFFFENDIVAKLDYREHEPNRVQVKLGACGEHVPNLELLCYLTMNDGKITAARLARVIPGRKLP
jgi:hypothetical protein